MGDIVPLRRPLDNLASVQKHKIDVPGSDQKLSVELKLVPAHELPELLQTCTNVASLEISGKPYFAIVSHAEPEDEDS